MLELFKAWIGYMRSEAGDENGQGLVEYSLIILLVVIVVIVAVTPIGPIVTGMLAQASGSF